MKTIITLLIALAVFTTTAQGQSRYLNEVFPNVTVTNNVVYGQNFSVVTGTPNLIDLTMDVYAPANDNPGGPYYEANRPLIVFLHSGHFLPKGPFFPFGNNRDSSVVEMSRQFAKRGFVVAAINYRVGWNPLAVGQPAKAQSLVNAIYRAAQDARTAVRFFRKNAATGSNTYRIDVNRVALAGMEAGGMAALAANSLNKNSELLTLKMRHPVTGDPFVSQAISGNFYGFGGDVGYNRDNHTGYSSAVQVVLNLGGAVVDTVWIESGESPIVSFHGQSDLLTPYGTATTIVSATGDPIIELSGSNDVSRRAGNTNIQNKITPVVPFTDSYTSVAQTRTSFKGLFPFPGTQNGFEPWSWYDPNEPRIINANNPSPVFPGPYPGYGSALNPYASRSKAEPYIDTIMNFFVPRALVAFANVNLVAVQTPDPTMSATGISVVLPADQTVCPNTQVTLSATVTGGTAPINYNWSANNHILSCTNCASPVVNVTVTDVFSVTVTDGVGATSTASVVYSIANTALNLTTSGSTELCPGESVTLSAPTALNYLWSNGATTQSITVTGAGTYTVSATLSNGCIGVGSEVVTQAQAPGIPNIVGNPSIIPFDVYTYSVNPGPIFIYNWSVQGGIIQSGETTNTITVLWDGTGPYSVTLEVFSIDLCSSSSTLLVSSANGINNKENGLALKVYPNPTFGNTLLSIEAVKNEVVQVEVLNIVGASVWNSSLNLTLGENTTVLNLQDAAPGIYLVRLTAADGSYRGSYRLAKQ